MTPMAANESNEAAQRLRHWLLNGPAQIADGPEQGAIAGTINSAGQADYAYGEITGYYLHWLASAHLRRVVDEAWLIAKAKAAVSWCERRFDQAHSVPTRIALGDSSSTITDDWRNKAEFSFDLAMLVGGLVAARRRSLIETPKSLLSALLSRLENCAREEGLAPLLCGVNASDLPQRWSTQSGHFLTKAAARILSAEFIVEVPVALAAACHAHIERFGSTGPIASYPLHPTLYYLEGELAVACERNGASASALKRLVNAGADDGSLPESAATADIRRADIVAQALRVGVLLRACGERKAPTEKQLDRLAANLSSRVNADGSIAFQPHATPPQRNVWCAMFAEQALAWHAQWRTQRTLNANAWDIV